MLFRNILGAAYHNEPDSFSDWPGLTYFVSGLEICPTTGRRHKQFYAEFRTQKKFTTIKRRYPQLHFEARHGTAEQAAAYCKKDGDYQEFGSLSTPGVRLRLDELKNSILAGEVTMDDILVAHPNMFHQYGRTLRALEDYYLRGVHRTWMTTAIWYCGPTGVGKSHRAFEGYSPETHYVYPYDSRWWDGYRAQHTVIFNEFRGQVSYECLLDLIDKWPKCVSRRNCEPRPFVARRVIITSSKTPQEVYAHVEECDSLAQLLRRIEVEHLSEQWHPCPRTQPTAGVPVLLESQSVATRPQV